MMSDSTYKFHSFRHTKPKHSIKFHSAASSGKFKPQKIRRKPKFLLTGQTRWSSFDFRRRFHPLTVDKSRRGVAADRQINEKFHSAIIRILHPHRISARCRNLHCTPAPLDTSRMNPRCGNSASSTCRGRWQSQTFRAIYFYFQLLYPADTSAVNIGRQSSDRRKIFSFGKRAPLSPQRGADLRPSRTSLVGHNRRLFSLFIRPHLASRKMLTKYCFVFVCTGGGKSFFSGKISWGKCKFLLDIKAVVLIGFKDNLIPFDSPWRALQFVFWVGEDWIKCWVAESWKWLREWTTRFCTSCCWARLRTNASSDWVALKRCFVENWKSCQLI